MTVGQRIAQKRKELGLSQEALGEQVGVSRQAIYKWESDAALPEVEKLVVLSGIFSTSVGWLLGVEEECDGGACCGDAPGGATSEGLSEAQLRMVEEIVRRYIEAEKPPAVRRRRWLAVPVVGILVLCVVLWNLFSRLDTVTQDYQNLQGAINRVNSSVSSQIGAVTGRVEEILKSQNELTADYAADLLEVCPGENSAVFALRAVPKTYTEGMSALFLADCGESGTVEVQGVLGVGQEFSAQLACPLTDSITLSVVFVSGAQRETQRLEVYTQLYSDSFPRLWVNGSLWHSEREGVVQADEWLAETVIDTEHEFELLPGQATEIAELRVGLFRDQKLLMWYSLEERDSIVNGVRGMYPFYVRGEAVTLEPGHTYCEAAVVTDEYGRTRVYQDTPIVWDGNDIGWSTVGSYSNAVSPEGWEFDG